MSRPSITIPLLILRDLSWFKANKNFIGDKIVDFHRFRYVPERYSFNSRGKSVHELEDLYNVFLERYKAMGLSPTKWYRAGIYEGFRFDNGFEFKGYSSDGKEYDSYYLTWSSISSEIQDKIKSSMNDPDSFKLREFKNSFSNDCNDTYLVSFSGKNSFGATVTQTFYVIYKDGNFCIMGDWDSGGGSIGWSDDDFMKGMISSNDCSC